MKRLLILMLLLLALVSVLVWLVWKSRREPAATITDPQLQARVRRCEAVRAHPADGELVEQLPSGDLLLYVTPGWRLVPTDWQRWRLKLLAECYGAPIILIYDGERHIDTFYAPGGGR